MGINRHENYEILNLIGYGLAKFDDSFVHEFNLKSKNSFYQLCVNLGVATTTGTIKNRMDLFDPFFPNQRKGWWQKGNAYIHRKVLIDSLFGTENVIGFANIIKLYLRNSFSYSAEVKKVQPIVKSRFSKLQETGLEAELFFMNNYEEIPKFKGGYLEDARLLGDGYDFQINVKNTYYLAEIKGIRGKKREI